MRSVALALGPIARFYGAHRGPFLFYFLLLALVLARGVHYGFIGDEAGYVTLNTEELARHPWLPIVTRGVDTGHPMLYAYPVALWWRCFGRSNAAANVSMWIWAALALTAMHRLMQLIRAQRKFVAQASSLPGDAGKMPALLGMAAGLALFSTPHFMSLAAQYLDPVPYLALLLLMILAWATGRRGALAILACLVPLVRITACLSVLGFGLFDLGYAWFVQRRRSVHAVARAAAPYAASALVFSLYLFVKLVVLRLPLSTIAVNKFEVGNWDQIVLATSRVINGIVSLPKYSFSLLLGAAVAAVLSALWRRSKNIRTEGRTPNGIPGRGGIYAACFASMFVPTLFYCIYPHYPQPRYLLAWQAFIVLIGVDALIALFPRRPAIALAILAAWCGLQAMRWHSHWPNRQFKGTLRVELRIPPVFCLDILDHKKLCHEAADWVAKHRPADTGMIVEYPSQTVFTSRAAGFTEPLDRLYLASFIRRQPDPAESFAWALSRHPASWVLQTDWDVPEERLTIEKLMREREFREIKKFLAPSGNWIKISAYSEKSIVSR